MQMDYSLPVDLYTALGLLHLTHHPQKYRKVLSHSHLLSGNSEGNLLKKQRFEFTTENNLTTTYLVLLSVTSNTTLNFDFSGVHKIIILMLSEITIKKKKKNRRRRKKKKKTPLTADEALILSQRTVSVEVTNLALVNTFSRAFTVKRIPTC